MHVSNDAPSVLCIAGSVMTSQIAHTVGTLPSQGWSSVYVARLSVPRAVLLALQVQRVGVQ